MPFALKITEDLAADIRARVKSLDFAAIEKAGKAKDANGTFDVIISTEDTDRSGEIVKQSGWELANYKNNPIVLWGHDYYSLPIGVCTETYLTEKDGVPALGAKGVFLSADINPFAQQVRKLYEFGLSKGAGVGCTTSVGFIPKEFDENARNTITKAELLEFSFVPVPANQGVGPAAGRALTFSEAKELHLDITGLVHKGMTFTETLGYVPKNVSETKAPESESWSKPSLKDFTDKDWEDLSVTEKRHIAGHFAYSKENPPESFGDLKLPHHRAKDGAVVWSGVKAAMGALMGARGGVDVDGDRKAVYEHLAAHYREFEKDAPDFKTIKKEAEAGDSCTMDDGSDGELASDPKDPDGPLVCIPKEDDKSKGATRSGQRELVKALHDEHDRHTGEVDKAIDDFNDKAADIGDDEGEKGKKPTPESKMREHLKDLRDTMRDEHDMHRAKNMATVRSFDPAENKAFDKKPHLKALRDEHDAYDAKNKKAMDEFDEKCVKSVQSGQSGDENTDWITSQLDTAARVHKKAVTKIAKAMCRDAYGEEDEPDEKMVEILKEFLAPHVDPQVLTALTAKVGARISSATRERLREAHEHLKAATSIVEALHGNLGDDDGEEGRSDGDDKTLPAAPGKQRSRPARVPAQDALDAHLLAKEVLRGVTTAASTALERLNREGRLKK
jgi:hypothetical protein